MKRINLLTIKQVKLFIGNIKLSTKLIIIYCFTIIIPLMIVSEVILSISGEKIILQTITNNQESAAQTNKNIKELFKQYLIILDRICYDETLIKILHPKVSYKDVLDSIDVYQNYLNPIIKYDISLQSNDALLKIYYLNKTLMQDYDNYIYADDKIISQDFYKKAVEARGLTSWTYNDHYVYISRALKDNSRGTLIGVVSVGVAENNIFNLINESNKNSKLIIISDNNGEVISSNDRGLIGRSIGNKKYFSEMSSNENGSLDYTEMSHYKVIYNTVDLGLNLPKWRLITLIPLNNLMKEAENIRNYGILVCVLSLILSSILFTFFLKRITIRIKILVEKMQDVKNGDYLTIKQDNNDEIGVLTRNYNMMVESLKRLIHENYEANLNIKDITIKKREAELYALESQINPHFLFNTLESIRMSLVDEGNIETAEIVRNLASIMRRTLNYKGDIITLSEEIEFTKNYLNIQKYRFKEKISFTINIPQSLAGTKIPKLTVQPIVENAVKHGLENKRGPGCIEIDAEIINDNLILTIKDDGIGIAPERLDDIEKDMSSEKELKKSGSIGMKNVNDRIKLHYGSEYGLKVISRLNEGTCVQIMIPFVSIDEC